MRVIFLEDVPRVARAGEVKDVKNGYARNFLLRRHLAAAATHDQLQRVANIQKAAEQRRLREEQDAQALADLLTDVSITLTARASPTGRFYGSITAAHIAEELARVTGREFDRRSFVLEESIREPGLFPVEVRLGRGIVATIQVTVDTDRDQARRAAEADRAITQAEEAPATDEVEQAVDQAEEAPATGEVEQAIAQAEEAPATDEVEQAVDQAEEAPATGEVEQAIAQAGEAPTTDAVEQSAVEGEKEQG